MKGPWQLCYTWYKDRFDSAKSDVRPTSRMVVIICERPMVTVFYLRLVPALPPYAQYKDQGALTCPLWGSYGIEQMNHPQWIFLIKKNRTPPLEGYTPLTGGVLLFLIRKIHILSYLGVKLSRRMHLDTKRGTEIQISLAVVGSFTFYKNWGKERGLLYPKME